MNKKMLSAVAASAIALGLIGCGGGSSSSSATNTQPTKVKGVDGYVMNAKLEVTYWNADKNATQTKSVDATKSYYLTYDAVSGKKKAGEPVYSLADLNATVLKNLVSVVMKSQSGGKLADGSRYSPSFYDANANGIFDSSDMRIASGVSLSAPKGYSVVTPISTIIANQVTAKLSADKNETNLTNVVDAYTKDIANALGVDASTLKNVDPLTLVNSKDEKAKAYVVANAFAGALINNKNDNLTSVFNSLKAAKAPKTAADVIGNLATAAKAANDNNLAGVLIQVKSLIVNNPATLDTLIKSNLDKTRANSLNGGLEIVGLSGTPKDFNITDMTSISGANGYKINISDLDDINMTLAPNDKNVTNQKFTFVIRVADPKQFNAQDFNNSSLTVKVPFEVNSTNGNIAAAIPADAKVTYEGMNEAGTKIITGETNSSIFGTGNKIIFVSGNQITIKAKTLIEDIDRNESGKIFGIKTASDSLPQDIYEIQAGFITDSANGVDGNNNYVLLPKDDIVSAGGTINENVYSMISFNKAKDLVADMRGNRTGDNDAPNYDINYSSGATLGTVGAAVIGSNQEVNGSNVVFNVNTAQADQNVTFNLAKYDADTMEKLTSFTTRLTGDIKVVPVVGAIKDVNNSTAGSLQVTLDTNYTASNYSSITGKHPKAVIYVTPQDEFEKVGDEKNVTVLMNRPPYADLNNSAANFIISNAAGDFNGTSNCEVPTNGASNLPCVALKIEDYDGVADVNNTANVDINVTKWDLNTTATGISCTPGGAAATLSGGQTVTCNDGDGNTTTIGLVPVWTNGNLYVEFNDTNASGGWNEPAYEANATIQFNDRYGEVSTKKVRFIIK